MTQFLPPNLLALFAPREPIPYLPPNVKLSHEKRKIPYSGIATFTKFFETTPAPPRIKQETTLERRERKRKEKAEQVAYLVEQGIALWKPHEGHRKTMDPYKTLFVARINYDTSESKIKKEFSEFGPIRKLYVIYEKNSGKPRGYAFIEYEHERDMHAAYKRADGRKIDGRRVLVDVERGCTIKGWLPRRFGGGLGNSRKGPNDGPPANPMSSVRPSSRDRASDKKRNRSRSTSRNRKPEKRRISPSQVKKEKLDDRSDLMARVKKEKRSKRSRSKDRKRDKKERKPDVDGEAMLKMMAIKKEKGDRGYEKYEDSKLSPNAIKQEQPDENGGGNGNPESDSLERYYYNTEETIQENVVHSSTQ